MLETKEKRATRCVALGWPDATRGVDVSVLLVHVDEVHVRGAVVEGRFVEDVRALATLLVHEIRPHVVAGGDLLPAGGHLDVLED